MKKATMIIAALFTVVILTTTMNGCKKGENDPLISLKSRDGRITGTWKLTKVDKNDTNTSIFLGTTVSTVTSDSYDGTTWTSTSGGTGTTFSYSYEITIEKDGTWTSVVVSDGDKTEDSGTWYWLDSKKNKTAISVGNSFWGIDQLKNKEMITIDNTSDKSTDSDGNVSGNIGSDTRTYEKQ